MQRPERRACALPRIRCARLGQGCFAVEMTPGADRTFAVRDPGETSFDELDRAELTTANGSQRMTR